jgi:uncharacterized membrane protein YfcA
VDVDLLYVIGVVFVATLVRSTFGFGEALIAVPLLALRVPVEVAVPLAAALSVGVAAVVVVQDARLVEVRSAAWLVGASVVGIPFGVWLLGAADERIVKAVLAAVIVGFSVWSLAARTPPWLGRDSRRWMVGAGVVAGVLGGAYGMNGPPLVIYGALRRWDPPRFRATLQAYFLPASALGLVGYATTGLVGHEVVRELAWCVPGAAVAIVAGRALNRRLTSTAFVRWIYVGLIAVGVALLAQAA